MDIPMHLQNNMKQRVDGHLIIPDVTIILVFLFSVLVERLQREILVLPVLTWHTNI
jgi:hypothetical protein